MNQKVHSKQRVVGKMFNSDSCVVQKLRKSYFYTIIKGDFTLYFDVWSKTREVTYSIFYGSLEIRKGRYENLVKALPELQENFNLLYEAERFSASQLTTKISENGTTKIRQRKQEVS